MMEAADYTVLIVDDVVDNLHLLIDHLLSEGYQVRIAANGESALRRIRTHKPDIVLLDVNMPGMDGFETCRRLKAEPEMADVPVLFLTVASDLDDKARGFAAGGVDYITKPVDRAEVLLRLRTHLELARLRREQARHNAELESRVAARTEELRDEVARRTRSEQEKDILLDVVRKQSEHLQRLTLQLVEAQNRQRHLLTDDIAPQIRQHLEPMDRQIQQLLALAENAGPRGDLRQLVQKLHSLQRVCQRLSEIASEEISDEAPIRSNPLLLLSEREREVLLLTVNSYSTDEIARMLHVTPATVRTYRRRLMQKLEVKDNPELVRFAVRYGLVDLK